MQSKRALTAFMLTIICGLAMAIALVPVSANDDVIVQTSLSGAAINGLVPSGVAEHRTQSDGSRRFKVEVEDVNLPAGTVLNVLVNGTNIGTLTINSFRQGELERNTNDGQAVPNVANGTTVAVRTQAGATVASGAFTAASPTPSPVISPTPTPSPGPTASPSPSPSPGGERASVSFESANYSVAENGQSVSIKILRTGDISRDSKVDYRSSDVTAHERTDYTTAAGRLFFNPNEASKTITVLITDDGFVEGDETLHLVLFDAGRSTSVGTTGTTTITIKDNDTAANVANPVDVSSSFVVQHYMDFLNREPEPEGLKGWDDVLKNCPQGDDRCDRIEVSSAFFRSPEFQDRGAFLYRFYSVSFGRVPRYAEFEKDMSRTSGFQAQAEQEANKALFADDFTTRPEFTDRYAQFTSAADYVNALLNTAGVTVPNKDALIASLQNSQMTRGQVLRAISESAEVRAKFYTESFVVMQYFGYLRRDPDASYLEWINIMNRTGEYRTMINGFMNSAEYRQRFGR
jgi:Calx-beta domain/Domain of unknown function (DUF4214)